MPVPAPRAARPPRCSPNPPGPASSAAQPGRRAPCIRPATPAPRSIPPRTPGPPYRRQSDPRPLSIHWRERFEHECHVGGMHRPQTLVELDQVLTMLQTLQQIAFGTFLAMGERLEDTMSVEHSRHIVEALLKARFRPNGCHRDPPKCVANDNRSVTKAALSRRNDGARVTAAIMEACHPGGCPALSPLVYTRRRGQIDGMCRLRASRRSWNGAPGGHSQRRRIRVNSSDI